MTAPATASRALLDRRIVVCVGCGGVGKTTIAAALALEAARAGRRALVLTIDPARRLADALGVESLGNTPQRIDRALLETHGVAEGGALSAMMLDMKRTFDDLVERFADSEEARERVLSNPIYQHASDALAGSAEYSAMEKVYELAETGDFDLIVVDTPPAQHALDFLEAPQRLLEFLDSRLVHMLIHPAFAAGRFGFRIFHRGARRVLQLMERVSGIGFLEDLSEFLLAFEGMAEGFRSRATRVRDLLLGDTSSFVLVTGAERESVKQSLQFLARLETHHVPLAAVVANRVRLWPGGGVPEPLEGANPAPLRAALAAQEGPDFPAEAAAQAALDCAAGYAARVRRDAQALDGLRRRTREVGRFYRELPELPGDVHDLVGLRRLGELLFGPPEESSRGAIDSGRPEAERRA